jgi:hypothetical protein
MNILRRVSVTLALVVVLFSIPALAQKVETDYDHSVNFNQYHTYSWGHVRSTDPFFEQRIRDAVDHDLQAKGWQLVPAGGDVTLTAVAIKKNQAEYTTFYDGFGWGLEMAWVGRRYGYDNGGESSCRDLSRRYLRHFDQAAYMAGFGARPAFG